MNTTPLTQIEQTVLRRIADGNDQFLHLEGDVDYDTAHGLQQQRLVTVSEAVINQPEPGERASLLSVRFVLTEAGRAALQAAESMLK